MTTWIHFPKPEEVPSHGTLYIRTSDNVLEEEDYGVAKLELEKGIIISFEILKEGVHDLDHLRSRLNNKRDILKWAHFDSTGDHPEMYNEISTDYEED